MQIEELSKAQIVLLTLLVSFVTSIATGIVTVSLLDQAPPAIRQTVNRVVERTVERVVPQEGQGASAGTIREVTTVVNENDLVTESIRENTEALVRITQHSTGSASTTDPEQGTFAGIGFVVEERGIVATAGGVLAEEDDALMLARLADGSTRVVEPLKWSADKAIALGRLTPAGSETFSEVTFAGSGSAPKLGQSVVTLTGRERIVVATGIVSDIVTATEDVPVETDEGDASAAEDSSETRETETVETVASVNTNINSKNVYAGSPLINIFGEVLGISISSSGSGTGASYLPGGEVRALLAAYNREAAAARENATGTAAQ